MLDLQSDCRLSESPFTCNDCRLQHFELVTNTQQTAASVLDDASHALSIDASADRGCQTCFRIARPSFCVWRNLALNSVLSYASDGRANMLCGALSFPFRSTPPLWLSFLHKQSERVLISAASSPSSNLSQVWAIPAIRFLQ